MRRGEVFWGALLVILGVLLWLRAAGLLTGDIFAWFWPFVVIAAGVWILLGSGVSRPGAGAAASFSVRMDEAKEASLRIDAGMGRLDIRGGAREGDFLTGTQAAGMKQTVQHAGDRLDVRIEAGPSFVPFIGPEGGAWEYQLASTIPTAITIHAGASRLDLDFSEVRVTRFSFEGGASNLNLTLPAHVDNTMVDLEAGAASIEVRVPDGVALRLRAKSIGSLNVNESRFPRRDMDIYQSADYDLSPHRADVTIDGGATSVRVI